MAHKELKYAEEARGALQAARWVVGKKGFYEFGDIVFDGR